MSYLVKKLLTDNQLLRAGTIIRIQTAKLSRIELERCRVGNREYVGYGWNSEPSYLDRVNYPFPSIRFRPCTPEIMAIREKEKGDWSKLSIDEKKILYRASFCQTFAEMNAPSGEWKSIAGWTLIFISIALWMSIFVRLFVLNKAPVTMSKERRIEQYYRQVATNAHPISGIYRPPGAIPKEFKYNPFSKSFNE